MQRTYPPGVTCWIDTEQPDVAAAAGFYGRLFGWTVTEAPAGGYFIATRDGQDVAAIAPGGGTAAWNTYVAVGDADAAAAAVAKAGGRVTAQPADAGPAGRAATCTDPQGAQLRLWQAGKRLGAQVTNAPGTWNFSDLHTTDEPAARQFYARVFGWRYADLPGAGAMIQVPGYGDHLAATVDPGIHERQAGAPAGFADVIGALAPAAEGPARWEVTFTVADRDHSVATAEALGATVLSAENTMWSRKARLRDPQGAELTVSQFAPPES
ncbi:VOC family protein [Dactylosporangium vinaceum]|uniref:VOC family protein n=1 Tax=Dactylosporangium vinaceum TaxID=53362 RepID=A0ABV5M1Z8_9ACTN|nr:VOC family protein [Dactylosporangium vinaceum]UAB99364.1 VOC family protein [Dactylosporangium vinaceum]